jgi:hypothetical protein
MQNLKNAPPLAYHYIDLIAYCTYAPRTSTSGMDDACLGVVKKEKIEYQQKNHSQ